MYVLGTSTRTRHGDFKIVTCARVRYLKTFKFDPENHKKNFKIPHTSTSVVTILTRTNIMFTYLFAFITIIVTTVIPVKRDRHIITYIFITSIR